MERVAGEEETGLASGLGFDPAHAIRMAQLVLRNGALPPLQVRERRGAPAIPNRRRRSARAQSTRAASSASAGLGSTAPPSMARTRTLPPPGSAGPERCSSPTGRRERGSPHRAAPAHRSRAGYRAPPPRRSRARRPRPADSRSARARRRGRARDSTTMARRRPGFAGEDHRVGADRLARETHRQRTVRGAIDALDRGPAAHVRRSPRASARGSVSSPALNEVSLPPGPAGPASRSVLARRRR